MSSESCRSCGKTLRDGDSAWADDWKVLDVSGDQAVWRSEVRYLCDGCHTSGLTWRCDAHNVETTGDCPVCDDELIALTEVTQ